MDENLPPMWTEGEPGEPPRRMTVHEEVREFAAASAQSHEQLQRLYLLLEEKGVLSHDELAYVTGEGPKPNPPEMGVTSEDW